MIAVIERLRTPEKTLYTMKKKSPLPTLSHQESEYFIMMYIPNYYIHHICE